MEVNRTFESNKNSNTLCNSFFQTTYTCAKVPKSPISKSTSLLSVASSFFGEYVKPQFRINKMVNKT